jgi:hypothetical protein
MRLTEVSTLQREYVSCGTYILKNGVSEGQAPPFLAPEEPHVLVPHLDQYRTIRKKDVIEASTDLGSVAVVPLRDTSFQGNAKAIQAGMPG